MSSIRIGTRNSRLALAQAEWVSSALASLDVETTIVEITTLGDRIRDAPLGPHLGSSFFTKEIESALLNNDIDVAVHSCKDLATRLPDGLSIVAVPEREDPRDVVVTSGNTPGAVSADSSDLDSPFRVGTSSPRRKGILAVLRPNWTVVDQRGNVPTRVAAVDDGHFDGAVLAAAGLSRLGMLDRADLIFDPADLVPAAGQGALALQCRTSDTLVCDKVVLLNHPVSHAAVRAERAVLRKLQAGCQAPLGVHAVLSQLETDAPEDVSVVLHSAVATPQGLIRNELEGNLADPEGLGNAIAEEIASSLGVNTLADTLWAGIPPREEGQ